MFTHILLASDGSEDSLKAAQAAAELAQKFSAQLTLLSVFDPPISAPIFAPGGEALIDPALLVAHAEEVHEAVEKRTGEALGQKGVSYTTRRELGHPVDRIVSVAESEKVDLIVMGSRGMGGFQRFFLGSVSDGVLHHAHCPVLIVK